MAQFTRAMALLSLALPFSPTSAAVSEPTAAQLAYASTFAGVGAGTEASPIPAAHYTASRDISHAAVALHEGSRSAEKHFATAAAGFVEATTKSLQTSHAAAHGRISKDKTSRANTLRPANEKAPGAQAHADAAERDTDKAYSKAIAKTYHSSLLEVASRTSAKAGVTGAASG
eukprot:g3914.t1